jgi:hypothetical protein
MFNATQITTEEEAVSLMLSLIGESPITSLGAAATNADVNNALMLLRAETRAVCLIEWTFNRDENVALAPGVDGKITPPAGCVKVERYISDTTPQMRDVKFTVRGDSGVLRLYDRVKNTFVWTQTLYCNLTYLRAWADIPEAVRFYIWMRAGRKFIARYDGSRVRYELTAKDELEALAGAEDYELDDSNDNFLADSGDVAEVWAR